MNEPSFGGIIRGARVGFHWSDTYGCFIRISGDGPFLIEVHPGPIPPGTKTKRGHWAWWDADGDVTPDDLLDMIADLQKEPAKPASFWVDDDGKTVRP